MSSILQRSRASRLEPLISKNKSQTISPCAARDGCLTLLGSSHRFSGARGSTRVA